MRKSKNILIWLIFFFIVLFSVLNSFELTINNNTKYTYYLSLDDAIVSNNLTPNDESNIYVTGLRIKAINHINLFDFKLKEKTDYQNLNKYNNFLNIVKLTNSAEYKTSWKAVYVIAVSLGGVLFLILFLIRGVILLIYERIDSWNISLIRIGVVGFLCLVYMLGAIYNQSVYKFQNDSDDLTFMSFYLKDKSVGQVKVYNQDKRLHVDQLVNLDIASNQIINQCDITVVNHGLCYLPYNSSFGLQAYIFKAIGKLFNLSLNSFIKCCQFIESLLLALVLAELIIVYYKAYGKFIFLSTLIGISGTYILAKFAPSVYWSFWVVLLPFLISSKFMLDKTSRVFQNKSLLLILLFVIFLFKMLLGYEWLSTIVFSAMIPILWDGSSITYKNNFKLIFCIGLISLIAFILSILLWWIKLGNQEFYNSILSDIVRRISFLQSFGLKPIINVLDINDPTYLESLHVSIGIVIGKLLFRQDFLLFLGFYSVIVIFACIYWIAYKKHLLTKQLNQFAILICISFIAPLSWYVLAKPHSYVHVFLNYSLWFLPTGFYIYVFLGIVQHLYQMKKVR